MTHWAVWNEVCALRSFSLLWSCDVLWGFDFLGSFDFLGGFEFVTGFLLGLLLEFLVRSKPARHLKCDLKERESLR